MIREKEQVINNVVGAADVIITIISFIIAFNIGDYIFDDRLIFSTQYYIILLLIIPTWLVLLQLSDLKRLHRVKPYSVILLEYTIVVAIGLSMLFLFMFILKLEWISRLVIGLFGVIDLFLLYFLKIILYKVFKYYRRKGYNTRNIIIIADDSSDIFIERVINNTYWGFQVIGIITDSDRISGKYGDRFRIFPVETSVRKLTEEKTIDEVIYCKQDIEQNTIRQLIYACEEIGVVFRMQSQLFSMIATKAHINYFGDTPFLTFTNTPTDYLALKIKTIFDFFTSLIILILSSPMLLIIAIIIKSTSKGPVIFKQMRVGLRGRKFAAYKFRTMVQDAEKRQEELLNLNEVDGPVFKITNDPRITKVGRFLRKTSLDEFPQFFNVLKGDMSIVGPRPALPKEVEKYERWQLRRLSMKPGITCIWQVSGRNNISFEEWMKLDLEYIDTWSLKLDFILFIKTIKTVFKSDGK